MSDTKLIRDDAWIISDTHFGHKNIIDYAGRPFESIEEMDRTLIYNWNSTVDKDDQVIFLGDFAFAPAENTRRYAETLNGEIVHILGNHDRGRSLTWWKQVFHHVLVNPIIYNEYFILSHEPIEWVSEKLPVVNIHGHTHEKTAFNIANHHINVSCEQLKYRPVRLADIIEKCVKLNGGDVLSSEV